MRFCIYTRKSVSTGKGESVENQAELCRRYILEHYPGSREEDMALYEDEGFSGKSLDRPEFRRLMRDLEAGRGECLVCYRLDRVSRNVGDFARLIEDLNARGVAFVCIREKFDTGTPMGKAMLYIASVFAQLERETIAQRVRDNMLLLARTGRWLGGTPPTGYAAEQTRELLLDGRVRTASRLTACPGERETVREIFRAFLALESLNGVQKHLHRRGIRARTGRDFSLPGLREMLRNPVYCVAGPAVWTYFRQRGADVCFSPEDCGGGRGLLAYNKRDYTGGRSPRNPVEEWIIALGRHEGLVSGEDWVAVQGLLERRRGPAAAHNSYALLSGLVRCGECGGPMLAKRRQGGSGRFDYICQKKLRYGAGECPGPNLPGPEADALVWAALLPRAQPRTEGLRRALAKALSAAGGAGGEEEARRRLREIGRELDHLAAALGREGPFAQAVAGRVRGLEDEARRLQEQLAVEEGGPRAAEDGTELLDLEGAAQALTPPERRALVRLLAAECRWDGERLHLALYDPGGALFALPVEGDSPPSSP